MTGSGLFLDHTLSIPGETGKHGQGNPLQAFR